MIPSPQLAQLKASVDILDLTGRYTKLQKISRTEYAGPCPQCGGADRLHVNIAGWWFCRQCHEQRGDVIDWLRFAEDLDFVTACERLGARDLPAAAPVKPDRAKPDWHWQMDEWQQRAKKAMEDAAKLLDWPEGAPGRDYLKQRGIAPYTWRCWMLGYSEDSPPWDKKQKKYLGGPSITMPWLRHDDDRLMALRYRRIGDVSKKERFINKGGGHCVLYGLHQIDLSARTLVIVEGELNCLSVWQVARMLGVCTISIGSESITDEVLSAVSRLSTKYSNCIVWCDAPENALKVRQAVRSPTVLLVQSPKLEGEKVDANDMLQRGMLPDFLERKLARFRKEQEA